MAVRAPHCLLVVVLVGAAALAGCLAPREHAVLPAVSPPMAAWAVAQWPDATAGQLSHGRESMEGHCTSCHGMPSPRHETAKDWPDVMQDMAGNAKLGAADEAAMLRYILSARNAQPDHG